MALYLVLRHPENQSQAWKNVWTDNSRVQSITTNHEIAEMCEQARLRNERVFIHRGAYDNEPATICCSANISTVQTATGDYRVQVEFSNVVIHSMIPPDAPVRGQSYYNSAVNDHDDNDQTQLQLAVINGDVEHTMLLLNQGADPNIIDDNGKTLLHRVAWQDDVASLLLNHGADPNIQDNDGKTPLLSAATYFYSAVDATQISSLFLRHGADPNIPDNDGNTPLSEAVEWGRMDAATVLLSHGADPNMQGVYGITPLHSAASTGETEMIALLLSHAAAIDATDNNGWTPLYDAAFNGEAEGAALLLFQGADIHLKSNDGNTPLHAAAFSGSTEVASLLLSHGAATWITNDDGDTALAVAKTNGHDSIVRLINLYESKGLKTTTVTRKVKSSVYEQQVAKREEQ